MNSAVKAPRFFSNKFKAAVPSARSVSFSRPV
jgi:hypothetical protein